MICCFVLFVCFVCLFLFVSVFESETYRVVMAQWLRPWALTQWIPGSNPPVVAVAPFGKALSPHGLVPWRGLEPVAPRFATEYKHGEKNTD